MSLNACSIFVVGQGRRGDWVQCASCGEESLYLFRDLVDFVCSVCGCTAMVTESSIGVKVLLCRKTTWLSY